MIKRIEFGLKECLELTGHEAKEIRCGVNIYMDIKHDLEYIMSINKIHKYKGIKLSKDLNLSDNAIRIIIEKDTTQRKNGIINEYTSYINV